MTGRFVGPSGREIYFEEAGTGRPLLCLHGVGGGAHFFRGIGERLRTPVRTLAIDLPGTARSVRSDVDPAKQATELSLSGWIDDIVAFVHAQSAEPVTVLGHSLGTILALELWRAAPSIVSALIFIGGLPETRPLLKERLAARIAGIARDGGLAGYGAQASPGNFSAVTFRNRPEVVGLFERVFESQVPAAYVRSVEILLAASATDVVPTVTVPVGSISGSDDQYAPPEQVREFLSRLPHPARMLVLPEVGHLPFFEAPEQFALALDEVLGEGNVQGSGFQVQS